MVLRELLANISDEEMVCVGSYSSFLNIAPCKEIKDWLMENETATEVYNRKLRSDKRKGKRKDEKPRKAYIDRAVKYCEYCEYPHNAYVVSIEGNERGIYALRCEITGEHAEPIKDAWEEGSVQLIYEVLANIVRDITDFEVFNRIYCPEGVEKLHPGGRRLYYNLKIERDKSLSFIRDEYALSNWTEVHGDYIEACAMRDVRNRVKMIERRVMKRAWKDTEWYRNIMDEYSFNEREKIVDLIVNGTAAKDIVERVGRGRTGGITVQIMAEVIMRFETQMKRERRSYMMEAQLPSQKPIQDSMTWNNKELESYMRNRISRTSGGNNEKSV